MRTWLRDWGIWLDWVAADNMKQAVGLQFYFAGYDPRALPWAGMRQAVGLNQLDAQPAPDAIERPRELPWILLCAYKPTALP